MPLTLKEYAERFYSQGFNKLDWEMLDSGKALLYTRAEVDQLIINAVSSELAQTVKDKLYQQKDMYDLRKKYEENICRVQKSIYDFIDAIETQTSQWDDLCDCDFDGKEPGDDKYGHSNDCMTMKARRDVEVLLNKLEGAKL